MPIERVTQLEMEQAVENGGETTAGIGSAAEWNQFIDTIKATIDQLNTAIDAVNANVAHAEGAHAPSDAPDAAAFNAAIAALESADRTLQSNINAEANARASGDNARVSTAAFDQHKAELKTLLKAFKAGMAFETTLTDEQIDNGI